MQAFSLQVPEAGKIKMKDNYYGGLSRYAVCTLLVFASLSGAQEREWGVNREIVQVSESVYRWGSDNQYGA